MYCYFSIHTHFITCCYKLSCYAGSYHEDDEFFKGIAHVTLPQRQVTILENSQLTYRSKEHWVTCDRHKQTFHVSKELGKELTTYLPIRVKNARMGMNLDGSTRWYVLGNPWGDEWPRRDLYLFDYEENKDKAYSVKHKLRSIKGYYGDYIVAQPGTRAGKEEVNVKKVLVARDGKRLEQVYKWWSSPSFVAFSFRGKDEV